MFSWQNLFWQAADCPCKECVEEINPPFDYSDEINPDLKKNIVRAIGERKYWNQATRFHPTWEYYKNFDKGISIVKSEGIAALMLFLKDEYYETFQFLDGIENELVVHDNFQNAISYKIKDKAAKIFSKLKANRSEPIFFVPLENIVLAVSGNFLLFFDIVCDSYEYRREKERIRKRHEAEAKILFPIDNFAWNDKIDPDLFESLVKDLLSREPNVLRVRKVSPLNQPDGGRDLIMELNLPTNLSQKDGKSPYQTKNIVVQCKGYNRSVGKSDVTDIRDTIDSYNYDGYFLAVSSQITTPLTNYLDSLRNRGVWIDWWNRDDIEERLSTHKDILQKYESMITAT